MIMKKSLMLWGILALLFVASPARAQFKWGVEAGVNMSKAKISGSAFDSSNRTGWFLGPKAQFTIPVIGLSIDGAIEYSQKYLNLDYDGETQPDGTVTATAGKNKSLSYIVVPINLKWNYGFSTLLGIYVGTGPQYDWYLGGRSLNMGGSSVGLLDRSAFSWNFGVGINALQHFQLGVTYNMPLGNTAELGSLIDTAKKFNLKNNSWQVRLAYMF